MTYLLGGVAAAVAGEDVAIDVRHAGGPRVVDVAGAVGVGASCGLVHTRDGEIVSIVLDALQGAQGGGLGKIYANSGGSGADKAGEGKDGSNHRKVDTKGAVISNMLCAVTMKPPQVIRGLSFSFCPSPC